MVEKTWVKFKEEFCPLAADVINGRGCSGHDIVEDVMEIIKKIDRKNHAAYWDAIDKEMQRQNDESEGGD